MTRLFFFSIIFFSSIGECGTRTCAELLEMKTGKPKTYLTINGENISVRAANENDVVPVTRLIHDAFTVWRNLGLRLSPMFQTEAETSAHLVNSGHVAENSRGEIVGTFSSNSSEIFRMPDGRIQFNEGTDAPVSYNPVAGSGAFTVGKYFVFKKAAVRPDLANSGLGSGLYEMAEHLGREREYAGMILETVREAQWLYDWYVRLGFKPIGSYRYPESTVETILMIKPFETPL